MVLKLLVSFRVSLVSYHVIRPLKIKEEKGRTRLLDQGFWREKIKSRRCRGPRGASFGIVIAQYLLCIVVSFVVRRTDVACVVLCLQFFFYNFKLSS